MHIPVLLEEILSFFRGRKLTTFIDGTLGAGGHSRAILEEHPEIELLIGFDQDKSALELAKQNLSPFRDKIRFVHSNFEHIKQHVREPVDGILLDLGVSSMQLDTDSRGFSFLREGPLDMRMNQDTPFSAEDIVNSWPEVDLANVIYELGEERRSRQVAKAICQARRKERITTTTQLAAIVEAVIPRRGRIHPATLVFQGLRLAVNRELDVIKTVLPDAIDLLAPHGRLGVISFHSLEDRIAKETFKQNTHIQILTKKPLVANQEECRQNPRSRSAKLRFCEKLS
jgi:16S rRNA (cytosine1402-N4)-methyltransferase